MAGVLVLKVTASVLSNYRGYFPPDFTSDFLHGRDGYFWGGYHWAFYAHILSGPVSLVLGLILVADSSRARFPRWHRYLGRVQVACVLLLVTPSGLWMAYHAAAGPVAAVGLAALAVATATCAALGTRSAVRRRFADHRRWMWRCYLLLCSAVVLRLIGGLATVTGIAPLWLDPVAIWISWLVPLAAFELRQKRKRRGHGSSAPDRPRARAIPDRRELSAP
jgi:small-conductance mechanosensitive channel